MPALEAVEVEPRVPADSAIVLMHGLGADGHDFEPVAGEIRLGASVRWVFPHAPVRPVTINRGFRMRAWYDIASLDERSEDEPGIRESEARVRDLIAREEARGIPSERIVVAGFSQGGALALHTALRYPTRLGGVMALSTYLPLASRLESEAHPANAAVSVFMGHGTWDQVVPTTLGERSCEVLRRRGYAVEWHAYPIPHSVCPDEIADVNEWLGRVLSPIGRG